MYSEEAFNFATFGSVRSSRPAPATRWALSTDCRSVFEYWAKHLRQSGRSCPVGLAASEPENKNANEWQATAFPFAQQAYQPSWQPSSSSQPSPFSPKGPRFNPLPLHAIAPHAGWDTGYLSEVTQRKSLLYDAPRRKEVAPLPPVYSVWVMEDLPRTCTPPPALQQAALAVPVTPGEPPRASRIDALEFESPCDRRPQRASSEPPIRRPVSPLLPIRHRLHEPAPSPPGPPIDWFTFVPDLPILSPPPPRGRASLQGLELPTDLQAYERTYDQVEEYDSESPDEDIALHGWVPLVQERTRQLPFTPMTGPDTPAPPGTPVEQSPPLDPGPTQVPSPARPAPFVCQREVHHGPCVPGECSTAPGVLTMQHPSRAWSNLAEKHASRCDRAHRQNAKRCQRWRIPLRRARKRDGPGCGRIRRNVSLARSDGIRPVARCCRCTHVHSAERDAACHRRTATDDASESCGRCLL